MPVAPNPPLYFRCQDCGWSSRVKSDAIFFPDCCPKCGSKTIKLDKSNSILNMLKGKLGL